MSLAHPTEQETRRSRLVQYLAVAYTGLVVYGSLYPFRPWRPFASSPFAFLTEGWPRYYSGTDVALNVLGYLPLGLLFTLGARVWMSANQAAIAATSLGVAVSIAMEALQSYIPQRVPSNLDLLSNGLGALAGAVVAITVGERVLLSGRLHRLRHRIFLPGALIDAGFVMLAFWLFTQLYPAVWLFGNGDLRFWLQEAHNIEYSPGSYRWIETGVTAFNLAGVSLFLAALARPGQRIALLVLLALTAALLLKTIAALTLFEPGDVSQWLTPGAMLGIPGGILLYLIAGKLPRRQLALAAALLLLGGAVLVNIAPQNPYMVGSIKIWQLHHFLSFNGTTRIVSSVWPFAAALYLAWLWGRYTGFAGRLAGPR